MKKNQTLFDLVRNVSERDYQRMVSEVQNGYCTARQFYATWKRDRNGLIEAGKEATKNL